MENNSNNELLNKRHQRTINFLAAHVPENSRILDLGTRNQLSELMEQQGFEVSNTQGEDLDLEPEIVSRFDADVVTAFEILEHLVAPFNVLRKIKAEKVVATIPMRLWFAKSYRNPKDPWDRHYHEFEDWQFDWLLDKAGWKIVSSEKWMSASGVIGFRPLLRRITPRYYAVYAIRK